jgi:hypothetical protein
MDFEKACDRIEKLCLELIAQGATADTLCDALLYNAAPLLILAHGRRGAAERLRDLADIVPKEN